MTSESNLWAVVLAAGQGTRLQTLTTDMRGISVPKQFCRFLGTDSMLQSTIKRAERLVPRERIVVIVAREHREWWQDDLEDMPESNIIVQPENKGTAAGVLLPLLHILARDPDAKVFVLPSDHYIEDEDVLVEAIEQVLPLVDHTYNDLVLFGISASCPDAQYGWIVPAEDAYGCLQRVSDFVEKPPLPVARTLCDYGALWNSFMFVGMGHVLLRFYSWFLPELLRPFLLALDSRTDRWRPDLLRGIYATLPPLDFSKDLLERAIGHLWVASVPECGWSDLGTPERIASVIHCDLEELSEREILRFPERLPVFAASTPTYLSV